MNQEEAKSRIKGKTIHAAGVHDIPSPGANNSATATSPASNGVTSQGRKSSKSTTNNSKSDEKGIIEISDAEIQEIADKIEMNEEENTILDDIFPITLDMFWDNFISDNAKYSLGKFLEDQGEREIELDPWASNQVEENKDQANQLPESIAPLPSVASGVAPSPVVQHQKTEENEIKMKRQMRLRVNIKGVPFCNSSRCKKDYEIIKTPTEYRMIGKISTPDVPYGGYFYLQERWVIGSKTPNSSKIYLKLFLSVVMIKSTAFQKQIKKRSYEDFGAVMRIWVETSKKKKLLAIPERKKANSDAFFEHEVEDANAKRQEEKKIQDQQQEHEDGNWLLNKAKKAIGAAKDYKDKVIPANGQNNNNAVVFILALLILYLMWQIQTLQAKLDK